VEVRRDEEDPREKAEPDGEDQRVEHARAVETLRVAATHEEHQACEQRGVDREVDRVATRREANCAAEQVGTILADGRTRDPRALAEQMTKLLTPLGTTQIADNLVYSLADLDAHELANPEAARAYYDRIPVDYPDSGLRDDARWFGAQISEQLGDWPGAVKRLQGLLATRETSYFTGSYFSVWLDDAQLELGIVLRDSLHDLPGAAAAFRQLPKDYPASILRDDALYELAVTLGKTGDTAGRCAAQRELVKVEPDSKYVPRLAELGPCP